MRVYQDLGDTVEIIIMTPFRNIIALLIGLVWISNAFLMLLSPRSWFPRPECNSTPDAGYNLSWCFCLDILRHAIFTLSLEVDFSLSFTLQLLVSRASYRTIVQRNAADVHLTS
jgi:hypothetical protein